MRFSLLVFLATVFFTTNCKKQEANLPEALQGNPTIDTLSGFTANNNTDDLGVIDLSDIELEPVYPLINEGNQLPYSIYYLTTVNGAGKQNLQGKEWYGIFEEGNRWYLKETKILFNKLFVSDFDGDEKPDIMLNISVEHFKVEPTLYLSSSAVAGELLIPIAHGVEYGC